MSFKLNLFNKIFSAGISFLCGMLAVLFSLIISEGLGFITGSFLFVLSTIVFSIILFVSQYLCLGILISFVPNISLFPFKKNKEAKIKEIIKEDKQKLNRLKNTIKIKDSSSE